MTPSKEAIEAAQDKIDRGVYEYDCEDLDELFKEALEAAYAIDFAALQQENSDLKKEFSDYLEISKKNVKETQDETNAIWKLLAHAEERNRTLREENEWLKVELAKHQESTFHPDWSMLQATRESLKEHQEIIRNERTLLRELTDALKRFEAAFNNNRIQVYGLPGEMEFAKAIECAKAAIAQAEEVLK